MTPKVLQIAESMKEFGWTMPMLVDERGEIIAGHGRLMAAEHLGYTEAPCMVARGWSEAQKRAYTIADNKLTENATWDPEKLRTEFAFLQTTALSLNLTGFSGAEVGSFFRNSGGNTDPDQIPETPKKPTSRVDDIWILGDHRLACGDSTSEPHVSALLKGAKPHLMVTDPPYGVEYDANWRNEAERANGKPIGDRAIGVVQNDDRADWSEAYALFPGDVAYVWHAGNKANIVADSITASGFEIRAQIIWVKNHIVISRGHYHPKHEPCWYAVRKGGTGHWQGDRKQATVWDIDKPQKSETGHSTQKPVECMKRPIENNSAEGDSLYEPFSGSGTTIIAAEITGRKCYASELMPEYIDVAVLRWQEFTGKEATLEAGGKTFAQVKKSRSRSKVSV